MSVLFQPLRVTALGRPDEAFDLNVADEVPVRLTFNGIFPYGVMMMTPDDLEDFAVGYCLTERIVGTPAQIRSVVVGAADDGLTIDVAIAGEALSALIRRRPRVQTGHSGCGICGSDEIPSGEGVGVPALPAGPVIAIAAVHRALDEVGTWQTLNAATRMVHAAAWADRDGRIVTIREDIGRHNALDKLIGARVRAGDGGEGFCLLTSRYSFEMAVKTLRAGMAIVVAISAPTYRACRLAEEMNQTLVAIARRDGQVLFCGRERLVPCS
ncbi:formate dehydrogenase accessory sulfurtransferase FdhD [Gluconacetobacter sacchari]|uniref:Sulfur carrier protein FdhD n=2 Tax=Gluconacetobacter sacchari TaxID=92759 RepID=A0A7W4NPY2_9PROT|nr:formate dehydrogenase accessory sulfurtransferase FdhD [Gluconacetobacter sacchari]MBB2162056.1 formate dehydrogenase accessory sulfurtransferase FdhD [Gluconacetobacter sacchari]GBQ22626.1 formate dehydrogenase accessory protein FdhD [Gluconacetobacter sacchari DSM 12717]